MNTRKRALSGFLAAALLFLTAATALTLPAGAVTQGDIQAIRDRLDDAAGRKAEIEERLAAIRGDMAQAEEQASLIQAQVLLCEQQVSAGRELLAQLDGQIGENQRQVAELEAQEAAQLEEFYQQVRWLEETGESSFLTVLFQAQSLSDILNYSMLITDVMDHSERIVERLQATQGSLNTARGLLEENRAQQAQAQRELEDSLAQLEEQRARAQALLAQLAASESEYARKAAQLAADEAEMERELKEAEAKWAAQIAAGGASGGWYWPVPGYYSITSYFGGRYLNGKWDSHTGTDIGVPQGVEIHAAQSGVVTLSRYNASYGNYCIISHGNGYATLYAHQKQLPLVKVGDTVEKGQVIGYVGNTGNSYGAHLHFELRVDGVRDDVLKLYPGMNFIDRS